jgi:two-component system, NarL family, nitrate/nitrite response regulator NarL
MEKIRVILVDDHGIVREGIRMVLENDDEIDVVGEAEDIASALTIMADLSPDLVLLDIDLGHQSSLDHLEQMVEASPQSRILMLTGLNDEEANKRAMLGGAHGLVLKNRASATLLTAVKKVHAGEIWFDRNLASKVLSDNNRRNRDERQQREKLNSLTPREREIASLIAEGLVNKDIAKRLSITEKTVRNALTVIYNKLGVTNRLELAIYASKNGLDA